MDSVEHAAPGAGVPAEGRLARDQIGLDVIAAGVFGGCKLVGPTLREKRRTGLLPDLGVVTRVDRGQIDVGLEGPVRTARGRPARIRSNDPVVVFGAGREALNFQVMVFRAECRPERHFRSFGTGGDFAVFHSILDVSRRRVSIRYHTDMKDRRIGMDERGDHAGDVRWRGRDERHVFAFRRPRAVRCDQAIVIGFSRQQFRDSGFHRCRPRWGAGDFSTGCNWDFCSVRRRQSVLEVIVGRESVWVERAP